MFCRHNWNLLGCHWNQNTQRVDSVDLSKWEQQNQATKENN